jgi:aspartate/methionine/tyrosine aminotransferase
MSAGVAAPHSAAPSPGAMDFGQFIAWSQSAAQATPDAGRYCETRIPRAFGSIRPRVDVPESFATVHRCDLAREWCDVRGLPPERARTALICQGVRHGLGLILAHLAQTGQRVALPEDVYPVYWHIAADAKVHAVAVETFPRFDLPAIFEICVRSGSSILVLPAPLKLHGRSWTDEEVIQAMTWLREHPGRRLILDGVYSLGLMIDALTKKLIETDQVIYLDSLSKGWLHELTMGVAIIPERDLADYADGFRRLQLPQGQLFRARAMIERFPAFPQLLTNEIDDRRHALMKLLDRVGVRALPSTQGYLFGIEGAASDILEEHRLLTIPATVFGSKLRAWSIASALPDGNVA